MSRLHAFPVTYMQSAEPRTVDEMMDWARGMTLRDYFAAKAMQGDIASMASHADPAIAGAYIAERAYAIADAMLKAREA